MRSRTLLALALLTAGHTAAFAQAPGDYDGDGSQAPGAPYAQPQYAPPPPQMIIVVPQGIDVMANRWSIGLSAGSLGVAPSDATSNTANTKFDVGEISLRFRVIPHLELELAIGGGGQRLDDGSQGYQQMQSVALAGRWRFAIRSHWNWWLMSGLGAASFTMQNATSDQVNAAQRPLFEGGIGLEHRWEQFALQAELKGIGYGPTKSDNQVMPLATGAIGNTTSTNDTYAGGLFTVGASYYF